MENIDDEGDEVEKGGDSEVTDQYFRVSANGYRFVSKFLIILSIMTLGARTVVLPVYSNFCHA